MPILQPYLTRIASGTNAAGLGSDLFIVNSNYGVSTPGQYNIASGLASIIVNFNSVSISDPSFNSNTVLIVSQNQGSPGNPTSPGYLYSIWDNSNSQFDMYLINPTTGFLQTASGSNYFFNYIGFTPQ